MRINSKACRICQEVLPIASFYTRKDSKDGTRNSCKSCDKSTNIKNSRTKNGYLVKKYISMARRVSGKDPTARSCVGQPLLSKDEFISWSLNNPDFHYLFKEWQESGYRIKYAPSIDRIDERFGYELWNMQFISHSENVKRANIFRNFNIIV